MVRDEVWILLLDAVVRLFLLGLIPLANIYLYLLHLIGLRLGLVIELDGMLALNLLLFRAPFSSLRHIQLVLVGLREHLEFHLKILQYIIPHLILHLLLVDFILFSLINELLPLLLNLLPFLRFQMLLLRSVGDGTVLFLCNIGQARGKQVIFILKVLCLDEVTIILFLVAFSVISQALLCELIG